MTVSQLSAPVPEEMVLEILISYRATRNIAQNILPRI